MLHLVLAAAIASPAPDPYQIFARARSYWDAQRYPRYVDYNTVVEAHDGKRDRTERYASAYDCTNGSTWVDPVSDYELAHPASGRGVDFGFGIGAPGSPAKAPHPAPDIDFIGIPLLAPNYSFAIGHFAPVAAGAEPLSDADIVNQVRAEFHDPNPHASATPTSSALSEIEHVFAYKRDYSISLAGDEVVNGIDTYHLTLAPFRVDGRHRLREVWVDKETYATVRARTALNFVDGPGTRVPWTIDFADVDGARYIASESAGATYAYAGVKYDRVAIRFEKHPAANDTFTL